MIKKNDTDELIKKVKNGDNAAFEQLSGRYSGMIDSLTNSFSLSLRPDLNSSADISAEDLRQEARLAFYRAAMSYDKDGCGREVTFGLYAKICVKNALISQIRKYKRHIRRLEKMKNAEYTAKNETVIDRTASRLDMKGLVEKAQDLMSEYEKTVFKEYISGKSAREISKSIGKSEKSVNNALYRVKVKIKGLSGE